MAKDPRKTVHDQPWEYMFPLPQLDTQQDYRLQEPGTFSRLTGVDGRYRGKLKRFPGFQLDGSATFTIGGDTVSWGGRTSGLTFVKFFAIQRGPGSEDTLRGWVFLGNTTTGGAADKLYVRYYDTSDSAWHSDILLALETTNLVTDLDVIGDHRQFYVVWKNDSPAFDNKLTWMDNGTWRPLGLFGTQPANPGVTVSTDSAGKLEPNKTYSLAYRIILPEQNIYSPLSAIQTTSTGVSGLAFLFELDFSDWEAEIDDGASRVIVQIFRTTESEYVTVSARGNLYLEQEVECQQPTSPGGQWVFADPNFLGFGITPQSSGDPAHVGLPVALTDAALTLQPTLNPDEVAIFVSDVLPATRMGILDGVPIVASSAGSAVLDLKDPDILRWGFVNRDRFPLIPVDNRRLPEDLTENLQALMPAGGFMAAVYNNVILRLHRSGSRIAIDTIHNRHGAVGRYGSVAIGTNLFLVSPVGILAVDLTTGDISVVGATQHFFDETGNWRNQLEDIRAAYDSELGALIFLRPHVNATPYVIGEALILWLNHGVLTQLTAMPFDDLIEGVDPVAGGQRKAYFVNTHADGTNMVRFYSIDADRGAAIHSTEGASTAILNFTAASGSSSSTIKLSSGSAEAVHKGHYLVGASGANKAQVRRIADNAADSYLVEKPFPGGAPAVGDRFSVAPIVFNPVMWPLTGAQQSVIDLFRNKVVTAMGAVVADISGDDGAGNPNLKLDFQLYDRTTDNLLKSAEGDLKPTAAAGATAGTFADMRAQGPVLVPGIQCLASNVEFDLLGVIVEGKVDKTKWDKQV